MALTLVGAGFASAAPIIANRLQLAALYKHDHQGTPPESDVVLQPYAREFQKILSSCQISSGNLMNDTLWWSGQASRAGVAPVTNLSMMQAITSRISWPDRRDCWNMFDKVEHKLELKTVAKLIVYRPEVSALYVIDHQGIRPPDDIPLVSYSKEFQRIIGSCRVSREFLTNTMIELADKASELGARNVTSLMMMKAITRRITWAGRRSLCLDTFDNAEGHMETGGP
ncbi:MAG TPA: hypothetical protein VGM80_13945 [Gaiellaceae bacterium]